MKKCINCNAEIKDEAKFCDECGAMQSENIEVKNDDNIVNNIVISPEEVVGTDIKVEDQIHSEVNAIPNKSKKRIILCVLALFVIILGVVASIIAHNNHNDKKKTIIESPVFDINEYLEICNNIFKDYNSKTEYFTSDEREEKGKAIMDESFLKNNIKPDCKIKLTGKVLVDYQNNSFYLVEKDTEDYKWTMKEDNNSVMIQSNNEKCLALVGEIVEIEGILSYPNFVTKAQILSPNKIEYDRMDNNILDLITGSDKFNAVAIGEVEFITPVENVTQFYDSYELEQIINDEDEATHLIILSEESDVLEDFDSRPMIMAFVKINDDTLIQNGMHIALCADFYNINSSTRYLKTTERVYIYDE